MREFLYRLVQRLQEEARPLSRNKHFHTFVGETGRALRIDRPRVRALPGGAIHLVLQHPTLTVVRTATLSAEEVQLLLRTPAGAWALGAEQTHGAVVKPALERG